MTDVVNTGTAANSGNGDPLRTAFQAINAKFVAQDADITDRFNQAGMLLVNRGAWAPSRTYEATPQREWVVNGGQAYVVTSNHVSGASFATDLASGKWLAADVAQLITDLDASSGSNIVGFKQSGTGAVATTVQSKLRESVSVKDFGAVGDGVTDDTAAIQAAINYVGISGGGTIVFPNGAYKVTAQINITYPKINLRGTGRRGVYPGVYDPASSTTGVSTIFANNTHPGPNMFRFFSNTINTLYGFSCQDLAFTMVSAVPVSGVDCFGWDMGHFQYDFLFDRVSIHYFNTGFNLYKTGALTDQAAALRIRDSNINQNNYIARTVGANSVWNGFEFTGCNAGQQGIGGIDIKATGAVIHNNILEGQPNPIKLTGVNSPFSIKNNYFELSSGFANIYINASRGAGEIGPNYHYNNTTLNVTNRVYLQDCCFVNCIDPYWADRAYRCYPLPLAKNGDVIHGFGNNINLYTSTNRLARVDDVRTVIGSPEQNKDKKYAIKTGKREINPVHGGVMQCAAFSSGGTTGTNVHSASFAGTTATSGQWLVVSWLVKYDHDLTNGSSPYITWVSGVSDGAQDTVLYGFNMASNAGEFYVYTAAYRIYTAITNTTVQLNFYPYGVSSVAGKTASISGCTMQVVDSMEDVIPYVDELSISYASSAPTTGTWKVGDVIYNNTPSAGGNVGWICTTSGTPGTWKTFGAISA